MSKWLSSVNNLLENLDGQAETVAETVAEQATTAGITSNLRRLNSTLANNATALTNNITKVASGAATYSNDGDDDEYYDDDDEYYDHDEEEDGFFQDDECGYDEEFTTDEDDLQDDTEGNDSKDPVGGSFPSSETTSETTSVVTSGNSGATGLHVPKNDSQPSGIGADSTEIKELQEREPGPGETMESKSPSSNQKIINRTRGSQQPSAIESTIPLEAPAPEEENDPVRGTRTSNRSKPTMGKDPIVPKDVESSSETPNVDKKVSTAAARSVDPSTPLPQSETSNTLVAATKEGRIKSRSPPKLPVIQASAHLDQAAPLPTAVPSTPFPSKSHTEPPNVQQQQQQQLDAAKLQKKVQQQQQQYQQSLASKTKNIQSLQSQVTKLQEEVATRASMTQDLQQQNKALEERLQASEREIEAQAKELARAGDEMELIRSNAKDEREDLMDDHEDAMEDIQKAHEAALDKLRSEYEKTIAEWKDRYESEVSLRQQEGGDSVRELMDANQREKEALKQLAEATSRNEELQTKLDVVVGHETSLKEQVDASLESAQTVAANEQRAREQLDEANVLHAKQMAQRQARESELEQTVLEMGTALTLAKQQLQQQANQRSKGALEEEHQQHPNGSYYKEQWEQVAEELETLTVQFTMETQRREALQQELSEVSKERKQELALMQVKQQQHDRKVAELESTIHRLQDSLRASNNEPSLPTNHTNSSLSGNRQQQKLEREIASLSEQLVKQQGLVKVAKSEILALKGRLQAANVRADEAEQARFATTTRSRTSYDVEGGDNTSSNSNNHRTTFSVRRRIKGGTNRGIRSIRSALPCLVSRNSGNPAMDQIGLTIDAIDSWMVDTGSFMRHEPFARLGLLLYLMTLHLWSFALVVFHNTEVVHGDFGSMDSNPRHWREHHT